jgi:hypothetical protein
MGRFTAGPTLRVIGWLATAVTAAAAIGMFVRDMGLGIALRPISILRKPPQPIHLANHGNSRPRRADAIYVAAGCELGQGGGSSSNLSTSGSNFFSTLISEIPCLLIDPNQLVELELDRPRIAVLCVLDYENH